MTIYDSRRLRRMPPLSARRLPPTLPPLLTAVVAQGARTRTEPFVGITTDGTPPPGLFPIRRTGVSTRPVVDAGAAFLTTLDRQERDAVTFPVDANEPWGWQLDGHHLNLHCFVLGDQMVMTPAFLGTEPCHVTAALTPASEPSTTRSGRAWRWCDRCRRHKRVRRSCSHRSSAPTCLPTAPCPSTVR